MGAMWTVQPVDDAYVVTWDGQNFGTPRETYSAAVGYGFRLLKRYPAGPGPLLGPAIKRRAGAYALTLSNGETVRIASANSWLDARALVLRRLGRVRLPRGSELKRRA